MSDYNCSINMELHCEYKKLDPFHFIIEEVSERYHQNFLLCNNNEITACIVDLFISFCEVIFQWQKFGQLWWSPVSWSS